MLEGQLEICVLSDLTQNTLITISELTFLNVCKEIKFLVSNYCYENYCPNEPLRSSLVIIHKFTKNMSPVPL